MYYRRIGTNQNRGFQYADMVLPGRMSRRRLVPCLVMGEFEVYCVWMRNQQKVR